MPVPVTPPTAAGAPSPAAPTSEATDAPPKLGQEIATTGDGRDITRPFLSGLQQPSDYILQRRGGNDLRIYEEVLRDAQVKATWGQRQLAVVSKEWQVDAGGDRRIDKAALST